MKKKESGPVKICATKFCRNKATHYNSTCSKCRMRVWRENHPIHARFTRVKASAKKRKIEFSLTIEQFTKFCEETSYHQTSGSTVEEMHIDRIDPNKGYSIDNIRILSCSENSYKGAYMDKILRRYKDHPDLPGSAAEEPAIELENYEGFDCQGGDNGLET